MTTAIDIYSDYVASYCLLAEEVNGTELADRDDIEATWHPLGLRRHPTPNIDNALFAADRHQAASDGLDSVSGYSIFAGDPTTWFSRGMHVSTDPHLQPFDEWPQRTFTATVTR